MDVILRGSCTEVRGDVASLVSKRVVGHARHASVSVTTLYRLIAITITITITIAIAIADQHKIEKGKSKQPGWCARLT